MTDHTPARINPDTSRALIAAMIAVGILASFSFILSFAGLSAIASWAAVPHGLRALVPGFIDGAILIYTYSALAARARGENAARPWTWVALWTAVSALANAAHAVSTNGVDGLPNVVGGALAALFPLGALLATHEIADRMIARPVLVPDTSVVKVEAVDVEVVPTDKPVPRPPRSLSRLTPEQCDEIARLDAEGLRLREIEAQTGIPKSTVHLNLRRIRSARAAEPTPTFVDVPLPLDGLDPELSQP